MILRFPRHVRAIPRRFTSRPAMILGQPVVICQAAANPRLVWLAAGADQLVRQAGDVERRDLGAYPADGPPASQ